MVSNLDANRDRSRKSSMVLKTSKMRPEVIRNKNFSLNSNSKKKVTNKNTLTGVNKNYVAKTAHPKGGVHKFEPPGL